MLYRESFFIVVESSYCPGAAIVLDPASMAERMQRTGNDMKESGRIDRPAMWRLRAVAADENAPRAFQKVKTIEEITMNRKLISSIFTATVAVAYFGTGGLLPNEVQGSTWVTEGDGPRLTAAWALELVELSEYDIHWQEHTGAWQSPNRANNLCFSYLSNGFVAQRRVQSSEEDYWLVALRVASYGKEGHLRSPHGKQLRVQQNTARTEPDDLIFDYINDRSGMRQSFTIGSAPGGNGYLSLSVAVELEGVDMTVDRDQNAVAFRSATDEVMTYSDLKAWDATGRGLDAWFEPVGPQEFNILVDDSGARFPITVDPLSSYWSNSGSQDSAKFGYAVSYGDFDGLVGDLVVGAPYYDDGQTDEGKVFVFYGTDGGTPTIPNWTAQVDYSSAHFGFSLAVGDVNGDGFDDLIVGAPGGIAGYSGYGNGFAWLGGQSGLNGDSSNTKWSAFGSTSGAKFGFSLAAGDFDGDGKADVLVGAPYDTNGRAYVYKGTSTGVSNSSSWNGTVSNTSARFGYSLASANVNGSPAIVVGAPLYDDGQTDEGGVFVWHGLPASNGTESNCNRKLEINQSGAQFGFAVGKTDVEADGYEDVIVGAPFYDNGQTDEGGVFVYSGSSTGLGASSSWSAESNQAYAEFGYSVAGGSLNSLNDTYGDVVVGSPYYDYGLVTDGGGTFVWYGSGTGLGSSGNPSNAGFAAYNQTSNTAHSGWSLATGDNVKYRGHAGIIIGSPDEDGNGLTDRGSVNAFAE